MFVENGYILLNAKYTITIVGKWSDGNGWAGWY